MRPSSASASFSHATPSSWYSASASTGAQTTFERSLLSFKRNLASRSTKRAWMDDLKATRLQDVINDVAKAQARYDHKKGNSKLWKSITSFSKRVAYYGKVLDVMVQHHPEYVSLAWGTLKFIFGVVLEHERLGSTIVTALSDLGEALSRIDLAESLYPTEKMKDTVAALNCHIMTFLCRALDWYESSSLSRTVQSFTRPAALRYDDLIQDINKTLAKVTDLATAGSQAEQRDMHEELRQEQHAQQDFRSTVQTRLDEMQHQLNALVQQKYFGGDMRGVHQQLQLVTDLVHQVNEKQMVSEKTLLQELVVMKQDIQATQADILLQLSEVQINQALSFISGRCAIDHRVAYEQAFLSRKVRRVTSGKCAPFWDSQKFQTWDRSESCSTITLTSTFRDRLNVRDFYVGVIEQLLQSHIPVFWIIQQTNHQDSKSQKHNIFEVLRSLVAQALKVAPQHVDASLSSQIRAFDAASSIEDYTSLLLYNLSQFKLAYVIVDTNVILPESIEACHQVLSKLSDSLREGNKDAVIKAMLVTHGLSRGSSGADGCQPAVVKVAQTSKRKSKRVPQAPLKGRSTKHLSMR